jgi:hypothetical protein
MTGYPPCMSNHDLWKLLTVVVPVAVSLDMTVSGISRMKIAPYMTHQGMQEPAVAPLAYNVRVVNEEPPC